ncbi:expressed unknown protein [Seminavis robusta]|uniref:Uncharacterized protein n=1 Tax=Seminavis robusta TaxID=568900 RepID=A0A9N8HPQ5_9STRA|nr:expressed unknown protein [Seminavis robusta]|eukprot:Sro1355_g265480.1 n/a (289) ;mRNA; r:2136-3002
MGKQDKSIVWEVAEEEGSSPSYGRSVVHVEQETKEARTSWELLSEEKEDEDLLFVHKENSMRQLDKIVDGALGCSPHRLTDTETTDGYSGMLAEEKDEEPGLSKSPKDDKSVFSRECSNDFTHGQITFEYSLPSVPETYPQMFPYHASVGGDHPCAQSASTGSDIASGPSDNVNSLMIRSAANSSAAFRAEVDLHIESKELNQRSLQKLVGPLVEPLIPSISIDHSANLNESDDVSAITYIPVYQQARNWPTREAIEAWRSKQRHSKTKSTSLGHKAKACLRVTKLTD